VKAGEAASNIAASAIPDAVPGLRKKSIIYAPLIPANKKMLPMYPHAAIYVFCHPRIENAVRLIGRYIDLEPFYFLRSHETALDSSFARIFNGKPPTLFLNAR
jgi:hypothetical protein